MSVCLSGTRGCSPYDELERGFAYKRLFGLTALHSDDFFKLSESTCTIRPPL